VLNATGPNGRVAVVDGVRTPFAKAGGDLAELSNLELATHVTRAHATRN
jgi:acetyl-CoA acetyltransferase